MKKVLIASAAILAVTGATVVYLLKKRAATKQGADNKIQRAKPAKHLTEVFSKAKGFHNQHAMG